MAPILQKILNILKVAKLERPVCCVAGSWNNNAPDNRNKQHRVPCRVPARPEYSSNPGVRVGKPEPADSGIVRACPARSPDRHPGRPVSEGLPNTWTPGGAGRPCAERPARFV